MNINNINNVLKNGYISNPAAVSPFKEIPSLHNMKNSRTDDKTDVVSISSNADSFRAMNNTVKQISEEVKNANSTERVNEIKTKVQNGTYDISSGAVADAILTHMMF